MDGSESKLTTEPSSLSATPPPKRETPAKSHASKTKRSPVSQFLVDLRDARRLAKSNHLPLLAAGIAFFGIFTVCPFLILSFLSVRYFFLSAVGDQSFRDLGSLLETMIPNIEPWLAQNLIDVLRANAVSNLFGIALLVWSVYELFTCLHIVFERISRHKGKGRNAFIANLVSVICFLFAGSSSAVVLFLFTTKTPILKSLLGPHFAAMSLSTINYLVSGLSILCVLACITFIYKVMPTQKVSTKHAIRGAVLFLMLFVLGRVGYQLYVAYYRALNENVYGNFFKAMVVMTWIYYLANSFLFSAQYAIFLEEKKA